MFMASDTTKRISDNTNVECNKDTKNVKKLIMHDEPTRSDHISTDGCEMDLETQRSLDNMQSNLKNNTSWKNDKTTSLDNTIETVQGVVVSSIQNIYNNIKGAFHDSNDKSP